ncbi:unnamed protein product [Polarella glacialis]|uniref:ABC transporter domain-containing protein n=1 Tax=Polarella glacialis TaxID=89957 RepID=A0A813HE63_POLGL|nr:unnamed protein product [Polarella glacialis]
MEAAQEGPALQVVDLAYCLVPGQPEVLRGICFELPRGARCTCVGPNGAGKSTLLELLSGQKMAPAGCVKVCGLDPFRGPGGKTALIAGGWRSGLGLASEKVDFMKVKELLALSGASSHATRLARLYQALQVEELLSKFYGILSDGQRRRVDLARKLHEPREVLLLDEATIDLDLLARKSLLDFLAEEAEERGCTVLNVTHVFDGLDTWTTHIMQLNAGGLVRCEQRPTLTGGLYATVSAWLQEACPNPMTFAAPPAMCTSQLPASGPAVAVKGLTFAYSPEERPAVQFDQLEIPHGCRCVLVGLNGCGKSSFLSIVAGRRLVADGEVRVLGKRAFHDHQQLDADVVILSSEWKRQIAELSAGKNLSFRELAQTAMGQPVEPALATRMIRLIQMLGVDPTKPLGSLSDGMMRRVQIALKLLRPAKVLLVDEVTADLDVLARKALLTFLKEDSDAGTTVIYCTHIMDGLEGWATHLLRMRPYGLPGQLSVVDQALPSGSQSENSSSDSSYADSPLFQHVREMLLEDKQAVDDLLVLQRGKVRGGGGSAKVAVSRAGEAELPHGWESRAAAHGGAFGNYAWKPENDSEDTWAFSSVAPPPPNMPQPAVKGIAPAEGFPAIYPTGTGVSQGNAGELTSSSSGGYGGLPASGVGTGSSGVSGKTSELFPGSGGYSPGLPDTGVSMVSGPSRHADDNCPFEYGQRSNQMSEQELIAAGIIQPEGPRAS